MTQNGAYVGQLGRDMRPLLKDTHPELREEWLHERNSETGFDQIRENSGRVVWWRCRKNPKHEWQAHVRRRAVDGNGCPFCSHLRVLKEESFAAIHPKLLLEWHHSRNGDVDPWKLSPGSEKYVWWQCLSPFKHEWRTTLATRTYNGSGCRKCNSLTNPLSRVAPEIAKEWHPTKNGKLTPDSIAASARHRAWWLCSKDPDHEWQSGIANRVRSNSLCPLCPKSVSKRGVLTLAEFDPTLIEQWHPTKNGTLTPYSVARGSAQRVWWICPLNSSHVWDAPVHNRSTKRNGCPFCTRRTQHVAPGRSLAERFPEYAREWHPTKNGLLLPSSILPGSSKRVWWQCAKISDHVWEGSVTARTYRKSKGRCPFCAGVKVTDANSLLKCHPEIAAQWHPTKNLPLTPSKVKRASNKRIWWQCTDNSTHEWKAGIKHRTVLGSGCPHCYQEQRATFVINALLESAGANVDYFKTFNAEMNALRSLAKLDVPKHNKQQQTMFRMLYSSGITAMETYLSDAFYHNVISNELLIEKLLTSAPELKERKYGLSEVIRPYRL